VIQPLKTKPAQQSALTAITAGAAMVTRGMVRRRAAELAAANGRSAHEVSKGDWDQAKQQLTARANTPPQSEIRRLG